MASKKKEAETMTGYVLRDVPQDMWRTFRSKCIIEGTTMQMVIFALIAAWIKGTVAVKVTDKASY